MFLVLAKKPLVFISPFLSRFFHFGANEMLQHNLFAHISYR